MATTVPSGFVGSGPTTVRPTLVRHRLVTSPSGGDEGAQHPTVGVVVPFDFGLDWEYWRYLPEDVALAFTRTPPLTCDVGVRLARSVGRPTVVARAARSLVASHPASVLYACSSGSFVGGVEGELALREAMGAAGVPRPVTTSGAMVDALAQAGVRRVAVATPYTRGLSTRLVDFLVAAGFEVTGCAYLGLSDGISHVSKETIASLVADAADAGDGDAEAVFVSCTALRTFGIVSDVEATIDRPVFTSNQVSMWAALDAAGLLRHRDPQPRLGGDHPARSTRRLLEISANRRAA